MRDQIEATKQLIEQRLQRLANESGIPISALEWRAPVETTTPADRLLSQLEFSVYGRRERHSILVPAGQLAAGAADEDAQQAWTEALAAIIASLDARP